MLLDGFTGLTCHELVELTGGVFAWGGEVLRQNYLRRDPLPVGLLELALILFSHALIDLLWSLSVCLAKFGQQVTYLVRKILDLQ